MSKPILLALAAYFSLTGLWLTLAPLSFYASVPGVSDTGPFNDHFARDVGLAFVASGVGTGLGALRADRALALLGATFPALHGLFHIVSLGHTAAHPLFAAWDIATTAGTAALALIFATRLKGETR